MMPESEMFRAFYGPAIQQEDGTPQGAVMDAWSPAGSAIPRLRP
jgi:hypothetical protein